MSTLTECPALSVVSQIIVTSHELKWRLLGGAQLALPNSSSRPARRTGILGVCNAAVVASPVHLAGRTHSAQLPCADLSVASSVCSA